MSIKAAGDFTRKIASLKPGAAAYLDGPYGAFTMDLHNGPGFVFIGAGVGITPLMSMLRTMADRKDTRPCYLFFGNREWEGVAFREEIKELESRLNLEVVHVLSRPPEGWEGEEGRIGAAVLARHLPGGYRSLQYFICGPDPMMDAAEGALVDLGVPERRSIPSGSPWREYREGLGDATELHNGLHGADHGASDPRLRSLRVGPGRMKLDVAALALCACRWQLWMSGGTRGPRHRRTSIIRCDPSCFE